MKYGKPGEGISAVEVTNVSKHGLWLIIRDKEVFLPFEKFPWFRNAPIGKIVHVELPSEQHLYWPELDVDLEVDSIFHPERFPLVSKVQVRETGEAYGAGVGDEEKIDKSVLALLQLTLHEGDRAWKGFDFEVLDRLYEKGFILDPRNKNKSVVLTEKGVASSKAFFQELFSIKGE